MLSVMERVEIGEFRWMGDVKTGGERTKERGSNE